MTVRVAQISDPHLSSTRPFFAANFARVAEAVRDDRPDLILATGDLALDGVESDAELAHAVAEHAAIGAELLYVPGNHDVGNEPATRNDVSTVDRVARWNRCVGASAWVRDLPGWRLIGLDNLSLDVDESQWEVIARGVRDAGTRSIALVMHKPLALEDFTESGLAYWPMSEKPRDRLLGLLGCARPALAISGHLHQWRNRVTHGIRQVWAPASSFVIGDMYQRAHGSKLIGWVEHAFHADGRHEALLRTIDGARLDDLGQMPQVYGPMPLLAPPKGH